MTTIWNPNTGNYALLVALDDTEAIVISEGTFEDMNRAEIELNALMHVSGTNN